MKNRIVVITSGKGGVGKTTTVINLGAAINYFQKDVLIVDGNLTTPNIGIHLNAPEVPVSLNHVLQKKADLFEAVYEHQSGMKVIPSSISLKELEKIKSKNLKEIKEDLKRISDYILVDCAAGLGEEALSIMNIADELIVVTNPEIAALTDALKTIKLAEKYKKPIRGVIVTRVRKDKIELEPETVKDMLEAPIIGMIPEDLSVKKSLRHKDAVVHTHPYSKAALAYKEIAAKLLEIGYDSKKDRPSFWKRLFGRKK